MTAKPAPVTPISPHAALVCQIVAVANVLHAAGDELEGLASSAFAYEIGTLRRKARAIVLAALAYAEGST